MDSNPELIVEIMLRVPRLYSHKRAKTNNIALDNALDTVIRIIIGYPLFIQAISIVPLQAHYYSEVLLTQHGYCVRVNTPKRHRQLRVKDLPKDPT